MVAPWVIEEMKSADLHDKRLDQRLREVLSQLAGQPTASIPAACGGHAEMTAAYRLFDNPKATWTCILPPHAEATRYRVAQQALVILAQDTTEVDLTRPQQQVAGAGPLDAGARQGAFLHLLHAFTPDGTPLGTLAAQAWTRPATGKKPCAALSRSQRAATPIREKESYRWVEFLHRADEEASRSPATQFVCVADSEADIYELLAAGTAASRRVDWIVRACQDRALQVAGSMPAGAYLRPQVLAQPVLFTQSIHVRGRKSKVPCARKRRSQPRASREAQVAVRAATVILRPPWRRDGRLPEVKVNVVLVREVNPPAGEEPVEWRLLTRLPVATLQQVRRVIQYYSVRWMIEVFFRVLKSGCRVEERRFEQIDRLLSCLAVYLIVAWRTLYICRMARRCPQASCQAIFEPAEWKAVWQVMQGKAPPRVPPSLQEMVRLVAQLGGYVTRRDPPGPQTIWMGLQRAHDFALCWKLFGPDTRTAPRLV